MIYILHGNDLKSKNSYIKKIIGKKEKVFLTDSSLSKDLLLNYASANVLFGNLPVILIEDIIKRGEITFSETEIKDLGDSDTIFIFIEDKLLAIEEKKYKKYVTIEKFTEKKKKSNESDNIFDIANAFAIKDKVSAWIFYSKAIEKGNSPEAIAGILFWKIKIMILNGSKIFSPAILKNQSSKLVSLYHLSHVGKRDFIIGLEQFILDSLS